MSTPSVEELWDRIAGVEESLTTLAAIQADSQPPQGELDQEQAVAASQEKKPGPWLWDKLDPTQQTQLWGELRTFVAYLSRRYLAGVRGEYQLPMCWYRHPTGVELLTALMVAHTATYYGPSTKATTTLVEFHESCLWPTLERLRQLGVYSSCEEEHYDRPSYGQLAGTDTAAFDQFVQDPTTRSAQDQ